MEQDNTSGAYLVIQQGSLLGKRVELWKECTTIGRSRACDLFLEDITVHRKQASILRTPSGYVLRDDHGSSDSFVNGQPVVKERLLHNTDKLSFGNTQMVFYASEGTRPFQLPISRGRELHMGKTASHSSSTIAYLCPITTSRADPRPFELLPEMSIGRSRECDVFLEDLAVSRLHATIRERSDGSYEIVDNRSATGTFVNGRAVTRYVLKTGDVVQIGASRFEFSFTPP